MPRFRTVTSTVGVLLIGAFLFACGGSDDDDPGGGSPPNPLTGSVADYEPVSGPAQMSRLPGTKSIVRGVARKPHEGRVWADGPDDEFGALTTTIVPIAVSSVETGRLPHDSDDMVYLELQLAPGTEASFDSIDGREGVFYLERLPDWLGPFNGIYPINAEAGRPEGQPLFQPLHPDGILVESAGGGVWSVESAVSYPDATLDDVLPTEPEFPPSRGKPPG